MANSGGSTADALSARLSPLLGERLITSPSRLRDYAQAEGHHASVLPALAAAPTCVAEVQEIVRACAESGRPLIAFGAGTSLEGSVTASPGALCLDLRGLDRVLSVAVEDMSATVQPGVTREQLNSELRATGLFFPVDPGANATLGGMISTRASGTNAVRYGTMRENTLALSVVLSTGELIRTGSQARKSSAGYDLTHLFVGAEGTLGVVVEATVRLHPQPETVLTAVCPFERLDDAVAVAAEAMQLGLGLARIELMDEAAMRAVNSYSRLEYPSAPTLFVEFHGPAAAVAHTRESFAAIASDHGVLSIVFEQDPQARQRLWAARHAALPAAKALSPGAVAWVTDVCVPISSLSEVVARTQADIASAGLTAPILGHVGDGNFHVLFILHPDDTKAWERAAAVNERMIDAALVAGGTCTGEHGVGLGKRHSLVKEHGNGAVALMRRLKAAIDPGDIMNPGKIFL